MFYYYHLNHTKRITQKHIFYIFVGDRIYMTIHKMKNKTHPVYFCNKRAHDFSAYYVGNFVFVRANNSVTGYLDANVFRLAQFELRAKWRPIANFAWALFFVIHTYPYNIKASSCTHWKTVFIFTKKCMFMNVCEMKCFAYWAIYSIGNLALLWRLAFVGDGTGRIKSKGRM